MFHPAVANQLGFYVYRLVDPRDGQTFYVGKGVGNRVFSHAAGIVKSGPVQGMSAKLDRIAAIHDAKMTVEHHIHRHGLDEATAFHVEAALIDAYPALTNAVRGHGADLLGTCLTRDLISRYQAAPAEWQHTMLLVSINRTSAGRTPYDAARFAWKLGAKRRTSIEYVLAVRNSVIVACFKPSAWLPGTSENFADLPGFERPMPDRWGFVGTAAHADVADRYVGRRLPEGCSFSQQGLRYVGPDETGPT